MFCWGSTENGELGLGGADQEQVLVPTFNKFASSWNLKRVAAGLNHTLFLSNDGNVYSCGNNEFGQLGHNKPNRRPEHIDALEGYTIEEIAAGDQHSLALTSWGEVYAWGENGFGQLGVNSTESYNCQPSLIKTLAKKRVIQISCGANHCLALTIDNEVYTWGQNSGGQLGLGHNRSPIRDPRLIRVLSSVPVKMIVAGGHHSMVLTKAGFLLSWGSNKYGQLGRQTVNNYSCDPSVVPNLAAYSEPVQFIATGENHTAVLDKNGRLWTFGSGRYGQLGHSKFDDNGVPQPVLDLVGTKVDQIACGRCHTLIYLATQGQVYAFGLGMSGQLGLKSAQNKNTPDVVRGPWLAPSGRSIASLDRNSEEDSLYVHSIFAGGDSSFVIVSKSKINGPNFVSTCPYSQPYAITEQLIDDMALVGDDDPIDDELFTYCERVIGALGCWNSSFLKNEITSKNEHSLNYRQVKECMNKLGQVNRDSFKEMINLGIETVVKQMPSTLLTPEQLRTFVVLPWWKGFSEPDSAPSLLAPFSKALLSLDVLSTGMYRHWWSDLPLDYLRLLLQLFKKMVVTIIMSHSRSMSYLSSENQKNLLLSSLRVLDLLHKENKMYTQNSHRLACEEFYIPEIAEAIDIRNDYMEWLSMSSRGSNLDSRVDNVCFCKYPFLFDTQAKTILLRVDATRQMQGAISEAVHTTNPLMFFLNPEEVQFLNLNVRRNNLVCDTLTQIDLQPYNNLKKPLKVRFVGEEGEDAGGVRKEFFLLLLKELLNPDYGMFTQISETLTIWFRIGALEIDAMYKLIGMVCGLAIYNFTIINLPFPLLLYKKLLGEHVGLRDLAEMDPIMAKGLQNLLDYDGDDFEDTFCLNFATTVNVFDETKTFPLKENGENTAVTARNKREYVNLMVDWRLNKSVESQYESFHSGFHRVCGGGVLKLFQPSELMDLVTGNENYDWNEFQKNTEYKGEYAADHPTILMFWEVFHSFSAELKKMFLLFLTGCDRIPIQGMKAIKMIIEPTKSTNYLPVAHTCVAQLDLPMYTTKEKLKYKLLQAIQQTEGFGLV